MLFLAVLLGIIAAAVASHKGRSTIGYFMLCFFSALWFFPFSIFFLIVLLVMSDLNVERSQHNKEDAWRRRHHGTLEEERSISKNFREHVIKRLDRQDEALGLPPINKAYVEAPSVPKEIISYPMYGTGTWYLVINGQEWGPAQETDVLSMLKKGEISGQTYAWSEGMQDWQRTNTIGNFYPHC